MQTVLLLIKGDIFTQGLTHYLEQWGCCVRNLFGSERPFAQILRLEPALVILDLPVSLDRATVAGELLGNEHSIPLLLLVSDAELLWRHALRLQQLPHYDYVPKPCPVAELKRAVEGLLGRPLSMPEGTQAGEITMPPAGWDKARFFERKSGVEKGGLPIINSVYKPHGDQ